MTVNSYLWQNDHAAAARAIGELAVVAEQVGDPFQVARRWQIVVWMACIDGRLAEARQAIERLRAAVEPVGDPIMEAIADHFLAFADVWQGEAERVVEHQPASLERALTLGAGSVVPWLVVDIASAEIATGRPARARDRLEALLPRVGAGFAFGTAWVLCLLAEARRHRGRAS